MLEVWAWGVARCGAWVVGVAWAWVVGMGVRTVLFKIIMKNYIKVDLMCRDLMRGVECVVCGDRDVVKSWSYRIENMCDRAI